MDAAAYEKLEREEKIEWIASVCYEANRAYCMAMGDNSFGPWADAPEWQRASNIKGVKLLIENPDVKPSDSHAAWLEEKRATGWKYGKVKDVDKKEHPCFVPYEELPTEQRAKDYIFLAIARSLLSR